MPDTIKRSKPEPIGLRVHSLADPVGGFPVLCYVPATSSDVERLKPAHHKPGDLVFVQLKKPRNPGFHRLAHAIGVLAAENIEEFEGMPPHAVLKRLQLESGAACEEVQVEMRSLWPVVVDWIKANLGEAFGEVLNIALKALGAKVKLIPVRIPLSLSFSSLDELQFNEAMQTICQYMRKRYWPSLTDAELETMLEVTQGLLK